MNEITYNLAPRRQHAIDVLRKCGFAYRRFKQGKTAYWEFSYDQGAFCGVNCYTVKQDYLGWVFAYETMIAEKFNFTDDLKNHMEKAFNEFMEKNK